VLDLVWEGMPVMDSEGQLIGSVKFAQAGDPAASAVTEDKPFVEESLNQAFARALTAVEPRVTPGVAVKLVRQGFLKVAGAGLMDHDRYVAVDQIASADDDVVRLAAKADQVVVERQRWI
jgi:hypothetical protein